MYKLWFENHPANKKFDTAETKSTFLDGGYYRADVAEEISVLSINTLEYNKDQVASWVGPEA